MKKCTKCGIEKPFTNEYFNTDNKSKTGLTPRCKKCKSEYMKTYQTQNKDRIAKYNEQWEIDNKVKRTKQRDAWYEENKESKLAYGKQWRDSNVNHCLNYREGKKEDKIKSDKARYENNKEEILAKNREWDNKNKDAVVIMKKEWARKNIDRTRQAGQRYEARKKKLPNTLTVGQWEQIKKDFNNSCAYCGMTETNHKFKWLEQLHQEHFIPLFGEGEYTHNNIIPSCRSCNSSKSNKDFFKWYKQYEHYDKKREQFILKYLGYTDNTQQLSIL